MKPLIALLTLILGVAGFSAQWTVDKDHSSASFKVKHLVVSNVPGSVAFVDGTFDIDDSDFTKSKTQATLDPNTINTNNAKRDAHLKSPDFLDVKKYPKILFVSKKIASKGSRYKITGDLTLHGITKEITLDADKPTDAIKDPWGGMRRGFSATSRFNRKDFGIVWNKVLETGGLTLGEELDLTIDVELKAPAPKVEKKT